MQSGDGQPRGTRCSYGDLRQLSAYSESSAVELCSDRVWYLTCWNSVQPGVTDFLPHNGQQVALVFGLCEEIVKVRCKDVRFRVLAA